MVGVLSLLFASSVAICRLLSLSRSKSTGCEIVMSAFERQ